MASYFGEIIDSGSRAFWTEEDDEDERVENSQNKTDFSIRWTETVPCHIKTLVIVEGDIITAFTKKCVVRDANEVCAVNNGSHQKSSIIYKVNDDLYLCNVSSEMDLKYAGEFVDAIVDILLKTEKIITLTSNHMSQFKSTCGSDTPSFLRSLATKNVCNVERVNTPILKQPNILSGVAAGVISYAEGLGLPAVLYVLYTDNFVLDSRSAKPLFELFSKVIKCKLHTLTIADSSFFNKGNIYMYPVVFLYFFYCACVKTEYLVM